MTDVPYSQRPKVGSEWLPKLFNDDPAFKVTVRDHICSLKTGEPNITYEEPDGWLDTCSLDIFLDIFTPVD